MRTKPILAISLITVLLVGVLSFGDAFAADKIPVCHNDKTKNIKEKDLQKHLDHGDTEGACPDPLDAILEMIVGLWDAIADLQEQINAIELLPGEKGEIGEAGPQGEQGLPGIGGLENLYIVRGGVSLGPGESDSVQVDCDPGDVLINAGRLVGGNSITVQNSYPKDTEVYVGDDVFLVPANSWRMSFSNSPTGFSSFGSVSVTCADIADPPHIPEP